MAKMCKDCEDFHIKYEPMMPFDCGQAECRKHDLVVDFFNHGKLNRLTCVEEEKNNGKQKL